MNITFSKSDNCKTKINFIIEKDFSTIIGFTGSIASEVFSQVRSAPAARTIHYNSVSEANLDVNKINKNALRNLPVRYDLSVVTVGAYNLLLKEIKAIIANAGHPVVEIYGFKYEDNLYGFDYGFELKVSDTLSIYTDFAFIYKDNHNQKVYGVDLDGNPIVKSNRVSCNFDTNNVCTLNVTKIPKLITNIFKNVRYRNFNFLPDLSILLNDLYTDLPENMVIFCEPGDSDVDVKAKVLLADSVDLANNLRNKGADLVAKAATSSKLQELINVGLAKVKQGTALDELGVIGLVNSGGVNVLESYVSYENIRYKIINGYPSADDLYKFLFAANKRVLGSGNLGVLNDSSMHYITDSLIAEQPTTDNKLHLIYDDASNLVGALSCYRDSQSSQSQSYIANEALSCVVSSDNLITSADMSEIAVTSLNMSSFLKEQEKLLAEYNAKAAALNYDDIISNIQYIDRQVSECFNAFTTLDSAAQIISARAAVYLKCIKQILNFPLKTGYSAIEFGKLAEAISVDTNKNTAIITSTYTPYFQRQYYKCCYGKFTINNGDPGQNGENDIFVGSVYASLLNDVDGGLKLQKYANKPYVVTNEQTHGSGKCKKVVVPYTETEYRITEKYNTFLEEIVLILNSLLNKELMLKLKDVQAAVTDVATSCSKIGERRKPYMEKLIKYREYQEQAFMINHVIELIKKDFRYEDKLVMPKDCATRSIAIKENETVNDEDSTKWKRILRDGYSNRTEIVSYTNSLLRGLSIDDIQADIDQDIVDEFNTNLAQIKNKQIEIAAKVSKTKELMDDYNKAMAEVENKEDSNLVAPIKPELITISLNIGIICDPASASNNFTTIYEIQHNEDREKSIIIAKDFEEEVKNIDSECLQLYNKALSLASKFKKKVRESLKQRGYRHNGKKLKIHSIEDFESSVQEKIRVTMEMFKSLPDIINFKENHEDLQSDFIEINEEVILWCMYGNNNADVDRTFDYLVIPVYHNLDNKIERDDKIQIGKLTYSIETLLKHEHIFNFMPFSDMIMNKIKYTLFGNTEVTDGEVYSLISERYGVTLASYYSEYISKQPSNRNLIALLAYGCVASPKRCLASLLAFQGDQLGVYLKKIGLETYNVSCVENQILKLIK